MKKAFTFLLCLCCTLMFAFTAFGATPDKILTYDLSSNGEHEISVNKGDTIIVDYTITASARSNTSTNQNQICYDSSFFELVPNSISVEDTYAEAYMTSCPVDSDGTAYVFFNSIAFVTFVKDAPARIGSFKLKVIADEGSSSINNTAFFATDGEAEIYGSDKQDLLVNIVGSQKHVHFGVRQDGVPSDEFSAGYKDYYKCSCNKLFEDKECTKEITDIVSWKAAGGDGYLAPGHKHGQVVKHEGVVNQNEPGYKDYYECDCGAYFEDEDCQTPIGDINEWKAEGGNGYVPSKNKSNNIILIILGILIFIIAVICILIKTGKINIPWDKIKQEIGKVKDTKAYNVVVSGEKHIKDSIKNSKAYNTVIKDGKLNTAIIKESKLYNKFIKDGKIKNIFTKNKK